MKNSKLLTTLSALLLMGWWFTGCSDNDDPSENFLIGTWKILDEPSNSLLLHRACAYVDSTVSFESNHKFVLNCSFDHSNDPDDPYTPGYRNPHDIPYYWELNNNQLLLSYGKGNDDDYWLGNIEFNGNTATYKYKTQNMIDNKNNWHDPDKYYILKLRKQ